MTERNAEMPWHEVNNYGTTDCPVEGVRAFVDDDECSACGGPVSDARDVPDLLANLQASLDAVIRPDQFGVS